MGSLAVKRARVQANRPLLEAPGRGISIFCEDEHHIMAAASTEKHGFMERRLTRIHDLSKLKATSNRTPQGPKV